MPVLCEGYHPTDPIGPIDPMFLASHCLETFGADSLESAPNGSNGGEGWIRLTEGRRLRLELPQYPCLQYVIAGSVLLCHHVNMACLGVFWA